MGAEKFSVLQVELWHSEGGHARSLDIVHLRPEEMSNCPAEAVTEILRRARLAMRGATIGQIFYRDNEGDRCTLTVETLADAMTFVKAVSPVSDVGRLELHVLGDQTSSADTESIKSVQQELKDLARGLDLALVLPRFAGAALRLIEAVDQPALFQLVQTLLDFQEGILAEDAMPGVLPTAIAAASELPPEALLDLVERFREEASKIVDEQLAPQAPAQTVAPLQKLGLLLQQDAALDDDWTRVDRPQDKLEAESALQGSKSGCGEATTLKESPSKVEHQTDVTDDWLLL